MNAILLLRDIEYQGQNLPADTVNVLCIDINGNLKTAKFARLLYRKWAENVLAYSQSRETLTAMVDIDLTGRGLSACIPIAISAEESMILERIVDLVTNHTNQISKDGKIPKEMRWATSRILKTAIQEAESQKDKLINRENAIITTTTFQCHNCNSQTTLGQQFCTNCGCKLI